MLVVTGYKCVNIGSAACHIRCRYGIWLTVEEGARRVGRLGGGGFAGACVLVPAILD